ncbi:MAG: hypothetical protein AWU59_1548 [Methanolobus sp. T82-4]|nr:MAG: hypothetical protein AWU59_1548 [Methanolobus sp. T82-4]
MKNKWIQHLEKKKSRNNTEGSSFVEMLHSLAKLDDGSESESGASGYSGAKTRKYSLEDIQQELACDIRTEKDPAIEDEVIPDNNQSQLTEICRWTARSQRAYETGIDTYEDDYVRLLQLHNGQLVLRYNVAGEDTFEMDVGSIEEADSLIMEDNMTTSELYPGNPELQWSKK